jgi:hypothetical protein
MYIGQLVNAPPPAQIGPRSQYTTPIFPHTFHSIPLPYIHTPFTLYHCHISTPRSQYTTPIYPPAQSTLLSINKAIPWTQPPLLSPCTNCPFPIALKATLHPTFNVKLYTPSFPTNSATVRTRISLPEDYAVRSSESREKRMCITWRKKNCFTLGVKPWKHTHVYSTHNLHFPSYGSGIAVSRTVAYCGSWQQPFILSYHISYSHLFWFVLSVVVVRSVGSC